MWITRLFLALILVCILQAWFFRHWNLKSLTYRRYFSVPVANEGDTVTMVEVIRNDKLLPIPWVRIEAAISANLVMGKNRPAPGEERQFHRSLFSIPSYMTITRRHKVYCARRGYYPIKTVSVTTGDLLGVGNDKARDFATESVLTVYPKLLPISDIFSLRNSFTGDIVVRRWIVDDPFMIRGVREYTVGDPQNRINWKATARTGVMQVHDFDFTSDVRLLLIVNVETAANQWTDTTDEACLERTISVAASIAQYALDNGVETGVLSNGKLTDDEESLAFLDAMSGAAQREAIFELLARLSRKRRTTMPTLLEQMAAGGLSGYDILFLSAYTDEFIERQLEQLRSAGNSVEQLWMEAGAEQEVGA